MSRGRFRFEGAEADFDRWFLARVAEAIDRRDLRLSGKRIAVAESQAGWTFSLNGLTSTLEQEDVSEVLEQHGIPTADGFVAVDLEDLSDDLGGVSLAVQLDLGLLG